MNKNNKEEKADVTMADLKQAKRIIDNLDSELWYISKGEKENKIALEAMEHLEKVQNCIKKLIKNKIC